MRPEDVYFHEVQKPAWTVWRVLGFALLCALFAVCLYVGMRRYARWGMGPGAYYGAVDLLLGVVLTLAAITSLVASCRARLETTLQGGILILKRRFLPARRLAAASVRAVHETSYVPWIDGGGYGYREGRALQLDLHGGRRLVVGTRFPAQLRAALKAAQAVAAPSPGPARPVGLVGAA